MRTPLESVSDVRYMSLCEVHLRRLVQSHRIRIAGDSRPPDYDGVVELWFDDMDALLAARKSEEWKGSSEDEAHFIDPNQVASFVSPERVILDNVK